MKFSKKVKMSLQEESDVMVALKAMEGDKKYNTPPKYSPNAELHPNNEIAFSALHIAYLRKFPEVDPYQYLMNLRLITRIT